MESAGGSGGGAVLILEQGGRNTANPVLLEELVQQVQDNKVLVVAEVPLLLVAHGNSSEHGDGEPGLSSSITGSSVARAGGGGGKG